jgi:hypothetical protein
MRRPVKRRVVASFAMLAGAVAGIVPSSAQAVIVSHTNYELGRVNSYVQCPAGTHVVSGGGSTNRGFLYWSQRHENGWAAGADGGNTDVTHVTVYAVCTDRNYRLTEVREVSERSRRSERPVARCPEDTKVMSGGGLMGHGAVMRSLAKERNGWAAAGGSLTGARARKVSYAYCTPRDIRLRTTRVVQAASGPQTVFSDCPSGAEIISGGGEAGRGAYLFRSDPYESGWAVSTEPQPATAESIESVTYAYCL